MAFQLVASGSWNNETSAGSKFLSFPLPNGARMHGRVPSTIENVKQLNETMADIKLANGVVIDIGWYPERDSAGNFVITVFAGDWNNPLQTDWIAKTPAEAKRKTEALLEFWSNRKPEQVTNAENARLLTMSFCLTPKTNASTVRKWEVAWPNR